MRIKGMLIQFKWVAFILFGINFCASSMAGDIIGIKCCHANEATTIEWQNFDIGHDVNLCECVRVWMCMGMGLGLGEKVFILSV